MIRSILACVVSVILAIATVPAAESAKDKPVLDLDAGSFRAFLGWRTPVLARVDGKAEPLVFNVAKKNAKPEEQK